MAIAGVTQHELENGGCYQPLQFRVRAIQVGMTYINSRVLGVWPDSPLLRPFGEFCAAAMLAHRQPDLATLPIGRGKL